MYDQLIKDWIESHHQEILDKWMELARVPSVRGEAQENAPYGVECDRALRKAASFYGEGFDVKVNRTYGYGYAQLGTQGKMIGMFGHSDVVPVGDGWIHTEPFEPIIKNGMLIGRGVFDNKSGVMVSWCVLNILKDLNIPLNNRIRAFIGSNEESGMGDITGYVNNEEIPALSLVPDSRFPCSLGEKGILRLWAKSKEKLQAVTQFQGGSAFNTVLDKVSVTVNGESFECEGISKHAGSPDGSLNAAYLACQKLVDTSDGALFARLIPVLESPFGEGLGLASEDPNFGKLTAANGMVKVEDGYLYVSEDIRYGASINPKWLEKHLAEKWDELGFEITWLLNRPGFNVDESSPVPGLMKRMFKDITGREQENYRMAGGTYSRYLPNAFTTGTHVYRAPTVELPAGHGGAHQRDEAISIEGFMEAVFYLTKVVMEIDKIL